MGAVFCNDCYPRRGDAADYKKPKPETDKSYSGPKTKKLKTNKPKSDEEPKPDKKPEPFSSQGSPSVPASGFPAPEDITSEYLANQLGGAHPKRVRDWLAGNAAARVREKASLRATGRSWSPSDHPATGIIMASAASAPRKTQLEALLLDVYSAGHKVEEAEAQVAKVYIRIKRMIEDEKKTEHCVDKGDDEGAHEFAVNRFTIALSMGRDKTQLEALLSDASFAGHVAEEAEARFAKMYIKLKRMFEDEKNKHFDDDDHAEEAQDAYDDDPDLKSLAVALSGGTWISRFTARKRDPL